MESETNSFGSNKLKLDEYGFGEQTVDFNKKIAQLAVDVCSQYSDKPRYVVGSMGPTGFLPSSNDPDLGQIPLDEIREAFALQAEGLILGGVDALNLFQYSPHQHQDNFCGFALSIQDESAQVHR